MLDTLLNYKHVYVRENYLTAIGREKSCIQRNLILPRSYPLCYIINNRDLTHKRRRQRRRRLVKNVFLFHFAISHLLGTIQCVSRYQNLPLLNMLRIRSVPNRNTKNQPLCLTFFKQRRTWSFLVAVFQRTAKKCTKNYNARAQLLFCSLNLLFRDVLVAVAVLF